MAEATTPPIRGSPSHAIGMQRRRRAATPPFRAQGQGCLSSPSLLPSTHKVPQRHGSQSYEQGGKRRRKRQRVGVPLCSRSCWREHWSPTAAEVLPPQRSQPGSSIASRNHNPIERRTSSDRDTNSDREKINGLQY